MLRITTELCGLLADDTLDVFGCDWTFWANIKVSHQVSKSNCEFSLRTKQTLLVELELVYFQKEIFQECFVFDHALQHTVHVAGVSQVLETHLASLGLIIQQAGNVNLHSPFDFLLHFQRAD